MAIYNRIFNKEKWEQVNKYNKNLMEDFLLELKSQKKSAGTINQYKNDIRIVFIYILDELDNKSVCDLKKKHFRNFMLWLQDKNLSNARVNRMFSALRSMLEFGSNEEDYEDELEINYASKVKGLQKEKVREIIFLTDEEVHIIFNHLMEKERYSEALLCGLMYDSAARRNELYQVKRNDIKLDSNFTTREVVGKRGKKFKLMYHDLTKTAFEALENSRTDENDAVWITRQGEPASKESLYAWCVSWRKILNNEKLFNAHSFRHSALEELSVGRHYVAKKLDKKFSIQELKLLAHHESIDTTNLYLLNKDDELLLEAFGV